MLDRVFLCCWTPPTGCESSQAAPMTPIQPSESRACVVVSPYAVLPRNFQSTLIWVTYNRQTIRRIPCTKNSYTRRCTKHEVRVSVELILEKPLWPHLAPPHITMEPASNCPISADLSYRAAKNAMHSATAAAPSGGSCQGRSGAQTEMLAPHSVGWGSVCNTTQNSIMSSGGSMQGIPLIHSIGLWVLPVDL